MSASKHFTPAFLVAWEDISALLKEDGIDKNGKASERARRMFRDRMLDLGHIERVRNLYRVQSKLEKKAVFLVPNNPQLEYLETRKGRDIILKVRQIGFTTLSGVRGVDLAQWEANTRTGIMAHKQNVVETLFTDIVKFTYDWFKKDWGHLYSPEEDSESKTELSFKDDGLGRSLKSSMRVMFDFQGKTIHFLHVSEAAFVEAGRLSTSVNGVPENGEVILESTPNGRGGEFHRQWQNWRAMKDLAPYKGHFIPWFIFYPERPEKWNLPEGTQLTAYERELMNRYPDFITEAHIAWRRWCIEANCEGDSDIFENQYPSNDLDCFLTGQNLVFPVGLLKSIEKRVRPPTKVGFLVSNGRNIEFHEDPKGVVQIWEDPKPGTEYVIGADPSSGIGKDRGAMLVKNRDNKNYVAMVAGQLPPEDYTNELYKLGMYYNKAWICPEENNHGHVIIQLLKQKHYPNLYKRSVIDEMTNKPTKKIGFQTTNESKIRITELLKMAVKRGEANILQSEVLDEMTTFVQVASKNNRTVKREAADNCHDDLVIAASLTEEMDSVRGKTAGDEEENSYEAEDTQVDPDTGFLVGNYE